MVQLSELVAKASELRQLNVDISAAENNLQLLKQKASKISEHEIPAMMEELGMTTFSLTGNLKVSIRPFYYGTVQGEEGYKWLKDQGYGDIVKAKLEIPFDFTDPGTIEQIKKVAERQGFQPAINTSVHHMTMGAFLREQTEAGVKFPEDKIKVYPGKKTYIS